MSTEIIKLSRRDPLLRAFMEIVESVPPDRREDFLDVAWAIARLLAADLPRHRPVGAP